MLQEMTVKSLMSTNPKIDLSEIDLLMALYAGGKRFDKFKKDFLIHREAETLGLANIDSRLKRAQYTNRAAGLIDWLVSSATSRDIYLEGDSEYWDYLSKNSDGMGTPFSSLVRCLLTDMLVARWPYVEARAIGSDPYTLFRRDPETVYDFENNENGELVWIKTVCQQQARTDAYSAPDRTRNLITYYTDTDTVTYTLYCKDGQFQDENGNVLTENSLVMPSKEHSVYRHDFGSVPIYRGNATKTHWLMDRISETVKAIYNTEVDLAFSLSQCSYAQLVFFLESAKRAEQIVRSESGAWVLLIGEKAEYLAPPNTAFDGLFKNLERLTTALGESLQMMAAETAAIPQAGRLSGVAVQEHRKPLDSLVSSIVWPVEDMLTRALEDIARAMGIDPPKIIGLSEGPEMEEIEEEMENGLERNGTGEETGEAEEGDEAGE
jgi:hypothetical protein